MAVGFQRSLKVSAQHAADLAVPSATLAEFGTLFIENRKPFDPFRSGHQNVEHELATTETGSRTGTPVYQNGQRASDTSHLRPSVPITTHAAICYKLSWGCSCVDPSYCCDTRFTLCLESLCSNQVLAASEVSSRLHPAERGIKQL